MKINLITFLFACIFYASMQSHAQSNPDAHTHGEGRITFVFDNKQMLMEMKTPAANMLGFEHKPSSDTQWQTLEVLAKTLHDPQNLIVLEPDCKLTKSDIRLPFERVTHKEPKETNNEHEHESEHEHDEHEHSTGDDNKTHSINHADIYAQYAWSCEKSHPPKLTFKYFDTYPNFKHLKVEWIVNGSQGMTNLHKNKNILDITQ